MTLLPAATWAGCHLTAAASERIKRSAMLVLAGCGYLDGVTSGGHPAGQWHQVEVAVAEIPDGEHP
jgi:hypothetical protein